ncbi:hypothetical protein [Massiliimalia timonensis]|uniref:hypothetical protein n=1 Tax=Massiliimalia timonensis TaxID=1987501 RepID=UPI00189C7BA3|nr:hypothetical protein [Massiliimalia timonensis]
MRLVNIQNLTLDYSGLAKIEPHNYLEICRYFANQIMELPTINPDDLVKHGEWEDYGVGVCCSNCGVSLFHQDTNNNWGIEPSGFEYCPYCGAKMDGGKENE